MGMRFCGLTASIFILVNGCAASVLPGGAGEVSGPLQRIELYTKHPWRGERYPTAARERLFASDQQVYVLSHWVLPGAGIYTSRVVLRTPTGDVYGEDRYTFAAEQPSWVTFQPLALPQGEAAKPLAGRWKVEVFLHEIAGGQRAFIFDPSSIRLQTDSRLVIAQGKVDYEALAGEWRWRDRDAVAERARAALRTLGLVFRDELARRFPNVGGPQPTQKASEAAVLLTPTLLVSPDFTVNSRLELEVLHGPTKTVRRFHWETSTGRERRGLGGVFYWDAAAANLAARATSSPEVLEFLITATEAIPQ